MSVPDFDEYMASWRSLLVASRRQVQRALASGPELGEFGLALVGMVAIFEGYMKKQADAVLPAVIRTAIARLQPQARYRLLPRLAGKASAEDVVAFESHAIHSRLGSLYSQRNAFAHGDMRKTLDPESLLKHWDSLVEALELIEVLECFSVPASRLGDHVRELETLRDLSRDLPIPPPGPT